MVRLQSHDWFLFLFFKASHLHLFCWKVIFHFHSSFSFAFALHRPVICEMSSSLHYFVVGAGSGCRRRLQVYVHMNGCFVWGIGILVWRNAQAGIFTVLVLFSCTRAVHAHEGTLCCTYNLFLFFLQLICCLSCGFFLWFSGFVSFTMNIETIAVLVVTLWTLKQLPC